MKVEFSESKWSYLLAVTIGLLFLIVGFIAAINSGIQLVEMAIMGLGIFAMFAGFYFFVSKTPACVIEDQSIKIYRGSLSGLKKGNPLKLSSCSDVYIKEFISYSPGLSVKKALVFEGDHVSEGSKRWYWGLSKKDRVFVKSPNRVVWMPPPLKCPLPKLLCKLSENVKT